MNSASSTVATASISLALDKTAVLKNLEETVSREAFNRSVTTVAQDLFTQVRDLQLMAQAVTFGNLRYNSKMLKKELRTLVVNSLPVSLENSAEPANQLQKELKQRLSLTTGHFFEESAGKASSIS